MSATTTGRTSPKVASKKSRPVRAYGPLYPPVLGTGFVATTDPSVVSSLLAADTSTADNCPELWSRPLAVALMDSIEGRRDLRTLRRWMTTELYQRLEKSVAIFDPQTKAQASLTANSCRIWRPSANAAEIVVTIWDEDRLRAIAMRMERRHARWTITSVECG